MKQQLSGLGFSCITDVETESYRIEQDIAFNTEDFTPKHPLHRRMQRQSMRKEGRKAKITTIGSDDIATISDIETRIIEQNRRFADLRRGGKLTPEWRGYRERRSL